MWFYRTSPVAMADGETPLVPPENEAETDSSPPPVEKPVTAAPPPSSSQAPTSTPPPSTVASDGGNGARAPAPSMPPTPQEKKAREFAEQAEKKYKSSLTFFGGLFGYVLINV